MNVNNCPLFHPSKYCFPLDGEIHLNIHLELKLKMVTALMVTLSWKGNIFWSIWFRLTRRYWYFVFYWIFWQHCGCQKNLNLLIHKKCLHIQYWCLSLCQLQHNSLCCIEYLHLSQLSQWLAQLEKGSFRKKSVWNFTQGSIRWIFKMLTLLLRKVCEIRHSFFF